MHLSAIALLAVALLQGKDPQTERLWKAKCSACHGEDGRGATDQGKKLQAPDLSSAVWQKSKTDAQIKDAIANPGSIDKGGQKVTIHGYKTRLKPEQLDALVGFVRGLPR